MAEQAWVEFGLRDAALAGDAVAWRQLVNKHAEVLRRYLAWRLGNTHCLDDLTQDVWLQAARSLRRFDPHRGPFEAWLIGIAFQVLRNHRRKVSRSRQQPLLALDPATEGDPRQVEKVVDALACLPEHYEQALRMKYLDGQSVACMATALGLSEKAVESLLNRAREKFRTSYQRETP